MSKYNPTLFGINFIPKENAKFDEKFNIALSDVYHYGFAFDEEAIDWLVDNLTLAEMQNNYQYLNQIFRSSYQPKDLKSFDKVEMMQYMESVQSIKYIPRK